MDRPVPNKIQLFFKPPFHGLLLFCWLYFVLCFVVHPQSSIMHGRFIDPDDTMYALQSTELLDGQGWYDRIEHRMDPPAGVLIHFSRLMELPYAATIGALTPFAGRNDAIFITSAIWPPLFLLGLLFAFRRQAQLFVPENWTGLTAFVAILAQGLLFQFMPGHIDHHGFEALLVGLCLGFCLSTIADPLKIKSAAAAGAILALALSIGLEILPWLLAFSTFIGAWACLKPERANSAMAFGGALSLGGLVLLPIYRAPSDLLTIDITTFSFVYLSLLFGIGLCMAVIWLLRRDPDTPQRVAKVVIFAAVTGTVFLCVFPELLQGPYGGVDKEFLDFFLPDITEAIPMVKRHGLTVIFFGFLPMPLISLIVCAWQINANRHYRQQMWSLIAVMQALAILLTLFYEQRYGPFAQLFSIIPIVFLAWKLMRHASRLRAVVIVTVMFFYPVSTMAFLADKPALDVLLYPMLSYALPCDVSEVAHALEMPPYNTGEPKLILNGMSRGADLLFETRHMVLSAPFHENINGNLDTMRFFRADNPQTAEKIVRRRGVDLVFICRSVEGGYLFADSLSANTAFPHPFVKSLLRGELPDWLSPVPLDKPSDTLLFQVKPAR